MWRYKTEVSNIFYELLIQSFLNKWLHERRYCTCREKQLEIKKWQVKEAEKQRVVKLSASDWLDHPDRYLLELAGRASYNESNK